MTTQDTEAPRLRLVSTPEPRLTTPEEVADALKGAGWDDDEIAPVLASLVRDQSDDAFKLARALVGVARMIA